MYVCRVSLMLNLLVLIHRLARGGHGRLAETGTECTHFRVCSGGERVGCREGFAGECMS